MEILITQYLLVLRQTKRHCCSLCNHDRYTCKQSLTICAMTRMRLSIIAPINILFVLIILAVSYSQNDSYKLWILAITLFSICLKLNIVRKISLSALEKKKTLYHSRKGPMRDDFGMYITFPIITLNVIFISYSRNNQSQSTILQFIWLKYLYIA